jgi:hypothetical protein
MLRERSRERTPGLFVALGDAVRRYARWGRRPLSAWLRWLERSVPADPSIRAFLEQQRPDVVLITPLITLGSSQIDYLRAARALRLPTALCVWSWDHLSSKALIRERPDRVFVWNDTQKSEAIEMHGVPRDRVVVTGAQCFDKWFDRTPSRDRETFRREAGLPLERPLILYVCSAPFSGSQPEAPFVVEWIRHLRTHGFGLAAAERRRSWCARIRRAGPSGTPSTSRRSPTSSSGAPAIRRIRRHGTTTSIRSITAPRSWA